MRKSRAAALTFLCKTAWGHGKKARLALGIGERAWKRARSRRQAADAGTGTWYCTGPKPYRRRKSGPTVERCIIKFFERVTFASPKARDQLRARRGQAPSIPIRYYATSLKELHQKFIREHPDMKPSFNTWRSMKPKWVRKLSLRNRCDIAALKGSARRLLGLLVYSHCLALLTSLRL